MMGVKIDVSDLDGLGDLEKEIKSVTEDLQKHLGAMAHAKATELASERLHSRRQMFLDALTVKEEGGVTILSLDAKAAWIDDGVEPHSMLEDLLKSPKAQRSKDGSSYIVIPFKQNSTPTQTPESQKPVIAALKKEFKARGIPWGKVERDEQGRPKLGKLHSFSVTDKPKKTAEGPGQGWGPLHKARQGPNEAQKVDPKAKGGGGTPFLSGVAVYQHDDGKGGAKKSVMTFRVASSKQGDHRWFHPGLEPVNIFADVEKWIVEEAEKAIPEIVKRLAK
jgi:hypothetical protein